jgi:hypothetical protein
MGWFMVSIISTQEKATAEAKRSGKATSWPSTKSNKVRNVRDFGGLAIIITFAYESWRGRPA